MTTQDLYTKVVKGEITEQKFLYEVRRDINLPFITPSNNFTDTVTILKNKGMISEKQAKLSSGSRGRKWIVREPKSPLCVTDSLGFRCVAPIILSTTDGRALVVQTQEMLSKIFWKGVTEIWQMAYDNVFLTEKGFRLIDVGISALRHQVGNRLFDRFVKLEMEEFEKFRIFFLDR